MRGEWSTLTLVTVCVIVTVIKGATQEQTSLQSAPNEDLERSGEKRGMGTRDLVRLFLIALHNNFPEDGYRGSMGGIPFRPVRRIGSEFLGKRSVNGGMTAMDIDDDKDEQNDVLLMEKRRLGSEFLGKRRLGSEFLGKRFAAGGDKRAIGSEFLGKRRQEPFEWSWKRGRLGSEFLGKRSEGSNANEQQPHLD